MHNADTPDADAAAANTLLRYALTTDPFPLQASPDKGAGVVATLTVTATNLNPSKPVTLQGISITVPVGPDANGLTADATNVGPVAPAGWTLHDRKQGAGTVTYVFAPNAGQGSVGRRGLLFVFNAVTVNTQPGTCPILIKEGSMGAPVKQLFLTKFPNGWGAVSFWLDPPVVTYDGATTLHWSGPSGATYTIEYALDGEVVNVPAEGDPPLGAQGQYPAQGDTPLKLHHTTVFTLGVQENISGQPFHAQKQKVATVEAPAPQITFSANPASVDASAAPPIIQLQWTSENVTEISIEGVGVFKEDQAASGSVPVNPDATATYFATAYGLPGYTGPPALAKATVLFTGSQTSSWCDVWHMGKIPNPVWTLDLGHGHKPFGLWIAVTNRWGEKGHQLFYQVFPMLTDGVQGADLGTQGPDTPYSQVLKASYVSTWIMGGFPLYRATNLHPDTPSSPWTEGLVNVGQTWGFKFPDGRLALVWYASGKSDGAGIYGDKWCFTFNWVYYGPLSH